MKVFGISKGKPAPYNHFAMFSIDGLHPMIVFLLLCSLVVAGSLPAGASDYDHSPTVGPAKGWLMIHGGGKITPEESRRFVTLAGGEDANFVVIPTAAPDEDINLEAEQKRISAIFGVKHVTVLHTRDRQRANSAEFVEPLRHASAVWIEGGRQWRLVDAYLGTVVEKEIKALLARGGIVGGSSAGATIQGSFLVRGASATANNPDGDNTIMMAPGHEVGFGLLPNSAIDQHVIVRHRENDLAPVIAAHPRLLGIGIDQDAAILVHGDSFEVIGGKVLIHDGKRHDGQPYSVLAPGDKFNLKTRRDEAR
ncbi:MAG TPA: cyanophycinase [Candidatus Angelobacter sp.]